MQIVLEGGTVNEGVWGEGEESQVRDPEGHHHSRRFLTLKEKKTPAVNDDCEK